jgi:hypothetical protein
MAVRISSYLLGNGQSDDRTTGFTAASTFNGISGTVMTQDPTDTTGMTIKKFDGSAVISSTNPLPLGLLIEPTRGSTNAAANGDTAAGQNFDTVDYARGGNYSLFHRPGNFVDVYDDFRDTTQATINGASQNASCPFVANRTWAVGDSVYAEANALLDNVNAQAVGGARIGTVRAVSGSGAELILCIELGIRRSDS